MFLGCGFNGYRGIQVRKTMETGRHRDLSHEGDDMMALLEYHGAGALALNWGLFICGRWNWSPGQFCLYS